jgi:chemotaxis signal transduction protein
MLANQAVDSPATPVALEGEAETQQRTEQFITFLLSETLFGVPLRDLQGVEGRLAVTAIPHAAPWLVGICNLRGEIASVVDLEAFLDAGTRATGREGMSKASAHRPRIETDRGLVVRHDDSTYILLVADARALVAVPVDLIRSLAGGLENTIAAFVCGLYITETDTMYVLDVPSLIASSVMQEGAAVITS